jgi:hypothetical protein|tara:strand:+ start:764 stop:1024 length:261 start_codon:yes stop_codon:yes gene_type:complete
MKTTKERGEVMRKLNKKQKTMINNFFKDHPKEYSLKEDQVRMVEKVNWYETAHFDIQNYFTDLKIQAKVNEQNNSDYAKFKRGELC